MYINRIVTFKPDLDTFVKKIEKTIILYVQVLLFKIIQLKTSEFNYF